MSGPAGSRSRRSIVLIVNAAHPIGISQSGSKADQKDKAKDGNVKDLTLRQLYAIAYPTYNTYPSPQKELEAKALYFLRTCKPKAYKELKKLGYLEEALL